MAAIITDYPNDLIFSRDLAKFAFSGSVYSDSRFTIDLKIERNTGVEVQLSRFYQYGNGYNDFSERLDAYYANETLINFPDYATPILTRNYSFTKMTFQIQEYRGNPLTAEGAPINFNDYNYYMLPGGNSFDKFKANDFLNNYFVSFPPFLNTSPQSKRTIIGCKEYLNFISQGADTAYRTHVTLTYIDGSTSSYYISTSSGSPSGWDYYCWRIPCDYTNLQIAANASAQVWYYDVKILDNSGSVLTETKRFVIDRTPYASVRKIVWKNSRGGEDSFYFTGNEKFTTDNIHSITNKYVSPLYSTFEGSRLVSNSREQVKISIGSWLESKQEANWLRDMKLSNWVYEDTGTEFLPIEILPASFVIYEDEKTGFNIEFEYAYRFTNHSFTP